jgi:hypothetical protein
MFLIRGLVAARTWLAFIHHIAGLAIGIAAFFATFALLCFGVCLIPLMLAGFPVLGVMLRLLDWFARFERARFGFLLGTRIVAWPAESRAGYRYWIVPRWRAYAERATCGQVGYGLLRFPVSLAFYALTVVTWSLGVVLFSLPLYDGSLPSGGAVIGGHVLHPVPGWLAAFVVAGAGLLLAAPTVTRGLASADAALTRALLGPPSGLAARVAQLQDSRDRVVDAA